MLKLLPTDVLSPSRTSNVLAKLHADMEVEKNIKTKETRAKVEGEKAMAEVEGKAHRSHHSSYPKFHPGSEIMVP